MNTHSDKTQENKNQSIVRGVPQKKAEVPTHEFVDNRPEGVTQRKLQDVANKSPQVAQLKNLQDLANNKHGSNEGDLIKSAEKTAQLKKLVRQLQTGDNAEVAQLLAKAGDTVNLEVKPGGPPVFMHNKDIPGGGEDPKSGEIGGTGILDAGSWGTLGVSPGDFHRAHAISNAFGGGGGADNVAWWSHAKELIWTGNEEKVRGGGVAQIDAWKPGDVEKGTYKVTRSMKDDVDFKPGYLAKLNAAATWGLDGSRDAWTRFKTLVGAASTEFTDGDALRTSYKDSLDNYFSSKLDDLGYQKAGKNLIKNMKMEYAITTAGSGAGGSRNDLTFEQDADNVDPANFGLKNEPENIWKQMVAANTELFKKKWLATGNKRVKRPWQVGVAKDKQLPPINLTPQEDGWGIPK